MIPQDPSELKALNDAFKAKRRMWAVGYADKDKPAIQAAYDLAVNKANGNLDIADEIMAREMTAMKNRGLKEEDTRKIFKDINTPKNTQDKGVNWVALATGQPEEPQKPEDLEYIPRNPDQEGLLRQYAFAKAKIKEGLHPHQLPWEIRENVFHENPDGTYTLIDEEDVKAGVPAWKSVRKPAVQAVPPQANTQAPVFFKSNPVVGEVAEGLAPAPQPTSVDWQNYSFIPKTNPLINIDASSFPVITDKELIPRQVVENAEKSDAQMHRELNQPGAGSVDRNLEQKPQFFNRPQVVQLRGDAQVDPPVAQPTPPVAQPTPPPLFTAAESASEVPAVYPPDTPLEPPIIYPNPPVLFTEAEAPLEPPAVRTTPPPLFTESTSNVPAVYPPSSFTDTEEALEPPIIYPNPPALFADTEATLEKEYDDVDIKAEVDPVKKGQELDEFSKMALAELNKDLGKQAEYLQGEVAIGNMTPQRMVDTLNNYKSGWLERYDKAMSSFAQGKDFINRKGVAMPVSEMTNFKKPQEFYEKINRQLEDGEIDEATYAGLKHGFEASKRATFRAQHEYLLKNGYTSYARYADENKGMPPEEIYESYLKEPSNLVKQSWSMLGSFMKAAGTAGHSLLEPLFNLSQLAAAMDGQGIEKRFSDEDRETINKFWNQMIDPKQETSFWGGQVPAGFSSLLPTLAAGPLGGTFVTGTAFVQAYSNRLNQTYEELKANPENAGKSDAEIYAQSMPAALAEAVAVAGLMKLTGTAEVRPGVVPKMVQELIKKTTPSKLAKAAVIGREFGIRTLAEVGEELGSNLVGDVATQATTGNWNSNQLVSNAINTAAVTAVVAPGPALVAANGQVNYGFNLHAYQEGAKAVQARIKEQVAKQGMDNVAQMARDAGATEEEIAEARAEGEKRAEAEVKASKEAKSISAVEVLNKKKEAKFPEVNVETETETETEKETTGDVVVKKRGRKKKAPAVKTVQETPATTEPATTEPAPAETESILEEEKVDGLNPEQVVSAHKQYPVGAYVKLKDGRKGVVIHPYDKANPVVGTPVVMVQYDTGKAESVIEQGPEITSAPAQSETLSNNFNKAINELNNYLVDSDTRNDFYANQWENITDEQKARWAATGTLNKRDKAQINKLYPANIKVRKESRQPKVGQPKVETQPENTLAPDVIKINRLSREEALDEFKKSVLEYVSLFEKEEKTPEDNARVSYLNRLLVAIEKNGDFEIADGLINQAMGVQPMMSIDAKIKVPAIKEKPMSVGQRLLRQAKESIKAEDERAQAVVESTTPMNATPANDKMSFLNHIATLSALYQKSRIEAQEAQENIDKVLAYGYERDVKKILNSKVDIEDWVKREFRKDGEEALNTGKILVLNSKQMVENGYLANAMALYDEQNDRMVVNSDFAYVPRVKMELAMFMRGKFAHEGIHRGIKKLRRVLGAKTVSNLIDEAYKVIESDPQRDQYFKRLGFDSLEDMVQRYRNLFPNLTPLQLNKVIKEEAVAHYGEVLARVYGEDGELNVDLSSGVLRADLQKLKDDSPSAFRAFKSKLVPEPVARIAGKIGAKVKQVLIGAYRSARAKQNGEVDERDDTAYRVAKGITDTDAVGLLTGRISTPKDFQQFLRVAHVLGTTWSDMGDSRVESYMINVFNGVMKTISNDINGMWVRTLRKPNIDVDRGDLDTAARLAVWGKLKRAVQSKAFQAYWKSSEPEEERDRAVVMAVFADIFRGNKEELPTKYKNKVAKEIDLNNLSEEEAYVKTVLRGVADSAMRTVIKESNKEGKLLGRDIRRASEVSLPQTFDADPRPGVDDYSNEDALVDIVTRAGNPNAEFMGMDEVDIEAEMLDIELQDALESVKDDVELNELLSDASEDGADYVQVIAQDLQRAMVDSSIPMGEEGVSRAEAEDLGNSAHLIAVNKSSDSKRLKKLLKWLDSKEKGKDFLADFTKEDHALLGEYMNEVNRILDQKSAIKSTVKNDTRRKTVVFEEWKGFNEWKEFFDRLANNPTKSGLAEETGFYLTMFTKDTPVSQQNRIARALSTIPVQEEGTTKTVQDESGMFVDVPLEKGEFVFKPVTYGDMIMHMRMLTENEMARLRVKDIRITGPYAALAKKYGVTAKEVIRAFNKLRHRLGIEGNIVNQKGEVIAMQYNPRGTVVTESGEVLESRKGKADQWKKEINWEGLAMYLQRKDIAEVLRINEQFPVLSSLIQDMAVQSLDLDPVILDKSPARVAEIISGRLRFILERIDAGKVSPITLAQTAKLIGQYKTLVKSFPVAFAQQVVRGEGMSLLLSEPSGNFFRTTPYQGESQNIVGGITQNDFFNAAELIAKAQELMQMPNQTSETVESALKAIQVTQQELGEQTDVRMSIDPEANMSEEDMYADAMTEVMYSAASSGAGKPEMSRWEKFLRANFTTRGVIAADVHNRYREKQAAMRAERHIIGKEISSIMPGVDKVWGVKMTFEQYDKEKDNISSVLRRVVTAEQYQGNETKEQALARMEAELSDAGKKIVNRVREENDEYARRGVALGMLDPQIVAENPFYMADFYFRYEEDEVKGKKTTESLSGPNLRYNLRNRWYIKDNTKNSDSAYIIKNEDGTSFKNQAEAEEFLLREVDRRAVQELDRIGKPTTFEEFSARTDEAAENLRLQVAADLELHRPWTYQEKVEDGLITDPLYSHIKYKLNMEMDIARMEFLADLDKMGYTRTADQVPDDQKGKQWRRISTMTLGKSEAKLYGPIAGKYVPEDIYTTIIRREGNDEDSFSKALDFYDRTLMSLPKKAWTVYNPGTHFRNVLGNVLYYGQLGGLNPFTDYNYHVDAMKILLGDKKVDGVDMEHLIRGGVVMSGDFSQGEFKSVLYRNFNEFLLRKNLKKADAMDLLASVRAGFDEVYNKGKSVDDLLITIYDLEDQVFKVAAYLKYRKNGKMTDKQAAEEVRKWFPYYDMVPTGKFLQSMSFVNPFHRFLSENVRIAVNIAKTPRQYPKVLAMMMAPTLLNLVMRSALGVDDEDWRLIKLNLGKPTDPATGRVTGLSAVWDDFILIPWGKDNIAVYSFRNLKPFGEVLGGRVNGLSENKPWLAKIVNQMPLVQLFGYLLGKDVFRNEQFIDPDSMGLFESAGHIFKRILSFALPPLTPVIGRSYEELTRSAPKYFDLRPRDPAQNVLRYLAGVDVQQAMPSVNKMSRDMNDRIESLKGTASSRMTERLVTKLDLSKQDLIDGILNDDETKMEYALRELLSYRKDGINQAKMFELNNMDDLNDFLDTLDPMNPLKGKANRRDFANKLMKDQGTYRKRVLQETADQYLKIRAKAIKTLPKILAKLQEEGYMN